MRTLFLIIISTILFAFLSSNVLAIDANNMTRAQAQVSLQSCKDIMQELEDNNLMFRE